MRGGVPGGCVLAEHEDEPVASILKKGERISDAVERLRHRLRELAADRHRVRSSPWPSSLAKARAKAMIEQMAEAGAPLLESMIEHGSRLSFPSVTIQSTLTVSERPRWPSRKTIDTAGLVCWLLKEQLLAKISKSIDEVSDDKAALNQHQRDEAEAQITADALTIERSECALIWHAEGQGEVIDFRSDTNPLAVLGLRLVTAPAVTPGSSPMMSFDVTGSTGRR